MKAKLIPVILTAAVTSVATMFVVGRYQHQTPFFASAQSSGLPVNYTKFVNDNGKAAVMGTTNFEDAAAASVKAVVHIKTTTKGRTVIANGNDFWGNIFGPQMYTIPPQMGSGSGVVISPDGYIVTNNHVVADANEVTVTFDNRYTAKAKVIGKDPATDIAVIKVDEQNLPYMEFGNSDDVKLGQWVLAVGYPLSLDATVTAGIVSAKGRSIGVNRQTASAIESYIQTDAAVNPGNSGGPLVNTAGQVIGLNSAIASPTGSYAGYSYAIPSNIVRKAVNDIMKYGSVQRAYMGLEFIDTRNVDASRLSELGINDKIDGVYIARVMPKGGAADAGLQKGDYITAINGTPIETGSQMQGEIARFQPGDNITVTYLRSGKTLNTTLQLRNLNGTTDIIKQGTTVSLLGASFRSLSSSEASKYGISGGVMITDVGRGLLARQTNVRKGFVITGINEMAVNNLNDLQSVLAGAQSAVQIGGFYPGSQGMYYFGVNPNATAISNEQ